MRIKEDNVGLTEELERLSKDLAEIKNQIIKRKMFKMHLIKL